MTCGRRSSANAGQNLVWKGNAFSTWCAGVMQWRFWDRWATSTATGITRSLRRPLIDHWENSFKTLNINRVSAGMQKIKKMKMENKITGSFFMVAAFMVAAAAG